MICYNLKTFNVIKDQQMRARTLICSVLIIWNASCVLAFAKTLKTIICVCMLIWCVCVGL